MTQNILVTGSEGFLGRHVVRKLLELGHAVHGVDNLEPRVHGEAGEPEENDSIFYKVSYDNIPYSVLRDTDIVIHLAAQVGVADSMTDMVRYVDNNTWGTSRFLNDLEYSYANSGRLNKIVVASSMSVYGDPDTARPIYESHAVAPASVYGLTKYDQEMLCKFWGVQHDISTVALRFFNIYGPGQALHNPYTGVIANFANWLLNGERPIIYEDGLQTRDFVYVDDVADAVVKAALNSTTYDTYNISTGEPTTIKFMAHMLARALSIGDIYPNVTGEKRPGDIRHCIGNSNRFALEFDWTPREVREGLAEYTPWLREHAQATV